ncbi:MAG: exo-alpha-sialidase [Candidatus Heimdallarchaeota archaeon]|nr:exo-alpha-sialidase [Candidatus Heimdallarchaeota archaeon]
MNGLFSLRFYQFSTLLFFVHSFVFAQYSLIKPSELQIEVGSASHFNLYWEDNSAGEDGYCIERKSDDENHWVSIGFVPENVTTYQAGGCTASTTYLFRIKAYKGSVYGAYSEIVKGTTKMHFNSFQGRIIENSTIRQGEGSMIVMENGDYHLYFGSFTGLGDKDVARIARKVSKDKGETWSDMELVFKESGTSLLHPSVIRFTEGRIGVAYSKIKIKKGWYAWKIFRYSTDEGKTWSPEIKVSDDSYNYITGSHDRFVKLSNGLFVNIVHGVVQMKSEVVAGKQLGTDLYATIDNGLTWFKVNKETIINYENPYGHSEYGFYEASMVEYDTGKLAIFGRNATGFLLASYSDDFGKTWSEPVRTGIQHPLAPVRVQMIPGSNKILLIHNSIKKVDGHPISDRYALISRISDDAGKTWYNYKELEYDNIHHYSYPAINIDGDQVNIFYWKTELKKEKGRLRSKRVEIAYRNLPLDFFE